MRRVILIGLAVVVLVVGALPVLATEGAAAKGGKNVKEKTIPLKKKGDDQANADQNQSDVVAGAQYQYIPVRICKIKKKKRKHHKTLRVHKKKKCFKAFLVIP